MVNVLKYNIYWIFIGLVTEKLSCLAKARQLRLS